MSAVVCWAFGTPILLSVAHCKKNYADMISRQEQQRCTDECEWSVSSERHSREIQFDD